MTQPEQTKLGDTPTTTATKAAEPKAEKRQPKPQSTLNRGEKAEIIKRIKTEETGIMNPVEYEQMKILAADFIDSGSVPSSFSNASQVLMALQAGKEMSMSPVESMQSLYIVNGLLNIWGKAVPRRLRLHGFTIGYQEESANSCTAVVKNDQTNEIYTETLTFQEAQDSGYTTDNSGKLKIGWRPGVNRKLKLRYGALSILIKTYLPEVLGSVKGIVEVEQDFDPNAAVASDRDVIDGALANAKPAQLEDTAAKPVEQKQDDEV